MPGLDLDQGARAWRNAGLAQLCDVAAPWENGTVFKSSRYPKYWNYNVVRVERDPGITCVELIAFAGDASIGFSMLERIGGAAEVASAFVASEHRARGIGTALRLAAIAAGRDADDLWIWADDEDRPKQLYGRLGFRPALTVTEFLRLPERAE